jgi:hypothetical protein
LAWLSLYFAWSLDEVTDWETRLVQLARQRNPGRDLGESNDAGSQNLPAIYTLVGGGWRACETSAGISFTTVSQAAAFFPGGLRFLSRRLFIAPALRHLQRYAESSRS